INDSGAAIIGGQDTTSNAAVAYTVAAGVATAITGVPATGIIYSVAINDSGAAIGGLGSIPTPTTGIRSWLLKQG
ncbi:MAG: hypothetical protein WCN87_01650, partial [Chlamydiota bacterium]